ncbi:hypothetical protein ACHAXS_011638 [Conticribra weissflogii]
MLCQLEETHKSGRAGNETTINKVDVLLLGNAANCMLDARDRVWLLLRLVALLILFREREHCNTHASCTASFRFVRFESSRFHPLIRS